VNGYFDGMGGTGFPPVFVRLGPAGSRSQRPVKASVTDYSTDVCSLSLWIAQTASNKEGRGYFLGLRLFSVRNVS